MAARSVAAVLALALGGCTAVLPDTDPSRQLPPPDAVDPDRTQLNISCGGRGFPASVLDGPANAEQSGHPAAAALRRHLAEPGLDFEWLPDSGWHVAYLDDEEAMFVARADDGPESPPLAEVGASRVDGQWRVTGWGQCAPQADVGPGLGLASFRVAPGFELTPESTRIDVLVTEYACNSGEDARGRIVDPAIVDGGASVVVVFAVRPRGGEQACPSNPETPHLLVLPEQLGDRVLLDGSEVPPRDATTCGRNAVCGP